jgi:sigma-E factor negative regulatory protein RseA
MSNNNHEKVSALLDDELDSSAVEQVVAELAQETAAQEQFGRYALIGDVLRNEQEIMLGDDFANSISAAIADIDLSAESNDSPEALNNTALNGTASNDVSNNDTVTSITSHPSWGVRVAAKVRGITDSKAAKGGMQMAIAASVALVAVFGVNNMQPSPTANTPVLTPVPLVQGLSPVSADGLREKPNANQVTQSRINALMADHNQQIRTADKADFAQDNTDEKEVEEKKEEGKGDANK